MDDIYSSGDGKRPPNNNRPPRRPDRADTQELDGYFNGTPRRRQEEDENIYFPRDEKTQYEDISSRSGKYREDDEFVDLNAYSEPRANPNQRPAGQRPGASGARPPQQRPVARYAEPPEGAAPQQKAPRPKRRKRRGCGCGAIFLAVIAVILAALVAGGSYVYSLLGKIQFDTTGTTPNQYVDESTLWQDKNVTNILLIGVDRREAEEASRADTMILLSVDKNNKKIKLTSFMRDMWVDIPGHDPAKINAASTRGGAQLVMDTIEYNFNVRVDHYVLVDFEMFQKVVDDLGGIEVEVSQKEADFLASGGKYAPQPPIHVEAGPTTHLDGNAALWYSRIRYVDAQADFTRTQRQRKVLSGIIAKASDQGAFRLISLAKEIMPLVETNLTQKQLFSLGAKLLPALRYEIEQQQIPDDSAYKSATRGGGQSVLLPDLEKNKQILYDFLYAKDDPAADSSAPEKS